MNTNDAIPADELLSHRKWLNVLARRLVADESLADDIEQETWAIALERPPQTLGSMRAWLGRVARRAARGSARSASRRARRERLAARSERVPSAAEVVERVARQRRIVDAVLALEPSMRHVVLLRFYEGMAPREIASQLGLSANAVRTRLSRALAILRARLQAELGPDFRKLVLPLPVGWLGGGLIRGAVAALAIAGTLGAAWVAVRGIAPSSSPSPPQNMNPGTQPVDREPLRIRRSAPQVSLPSEAPKPGRAVRERLEVRVVEGVSGRPVRNVSVRYLPLERSAKMLKILQRRWHLHPLLHELEWIDKCPGTSIGATDQEGRVELRRPEGPVQVWARMGGKRGICVVVPGESIATVRLWQVRRIKLCVSIAEGPRVKNMPVVLEVPAAMPQPRWNPETGRLILEPRHLWWGRTDGNGFASISYVAPPTVRRARVSLAIPVRACEAVEVELNERFQRVNLEAPQTGRLDVQVVDPQGRRLGDDAIVSLVSHEGDTPIATRYLAMGGTLRNIHVAIGAPFTLTAVSPKSEWDPISATVLGPREPGGKCGVTLRVPAPVRSERSRAK